MPTDRNAGNLADPERDQPATGAPGTTPATIWRAEAPPITGTLSRRLAQLLLDHLTDTGDVVVDVDDDIMLARAAAEHGRRHHSLGGHSQLLNIRNTAGAVQLVLMQWPQPPANPRLLLAGCRALLTATGHLVIVVQVPAAERVAHLNAVSGAARTAGLPQVRHVAVIDDALPTAMPRHLARFTGQEAHTSAVPHTDLLIFTPRGGTSD